MILIYELVPGAVTMIILVYLFDKYGTNPISYNTQLKN